MPAVDARPPLDGFLILDFTRVIAGPFLTQMLGDLGAAVIKIEDPRAGDDMGRRWAGDGEEMGTRWRRDGAEMAPRWSRDGAEMAPRWRRDRI